MKLYCRWEGRCKKLAVTTVKYEHPCINANANGWPKGKEN